MIRETIELFVALAALAGFFIGLYQYRKAQRWKRLEFAASQLQRLTTDPDLLLAMMFLEYSKMDVPLPEKYRVLIDADTFQHDSSTLSTMMAPGYFERTPTYFIYREAFMRLFEYFEQLFQFVDMGLIQVSDIKGTKWVLAGVIAPKYIEKTVLLEHLQRHFQDVISLMAMLGIDPSNEEKNVRK
jgi:hypothetical protein